MSIKVNIVSAEEEIYSGSADMVVATTIEGEIGVCKNHTPLLAYLKPGTLRLSYDDNSEEKLFYISGGFLEVQPEVVTVLADTAIRAADIDEAAAIEVEKRARQALDDKKSEAEFARELAEIAAAAAQIAIIKRLRKGRG